MPVPLRISALAMALVVPVVFATPGTATSNVAPLLTMIVPLPARLAKNVLKPPPRRRVPALT
jgi:hypothetical protein